LSTTIIDASQYPGIRALWMAVYVADADTPLRFKGSRREFGPGTREALLGILEAAGDAERAGRRSEAREARRSVPGPPKGSTWAAIRERNGKIRRLRDQGERISDLSVAFNLHRNQIARICSEEGRRGYEFTKPREEKEENKKNGVANSQ
jgi:hypothetical protein